MYWIDSTIRPDPYDILLRYASGYMPDFLNKRNGRVGWVRWSHRGVQRLEKFRIPRKQKMYVLSPKFELRFDNAFEEVMRECANTARHAIRDGAGDTWIIEPLMEGMIELNRLGYAHSYEAWQDGKLVGGTFGIHLGGMITMSSLFHRVSNASKAAAGQAMKHLKERGFEMIDIGMVPDHHVDFGSEWMPRWEFEAMLPRLLAQSRALTDDRPAQPVPGRVRYLAPVIRVGRAIKRRILPERPEHEPEGGPASTEKHAVASTPEQASDASPDPSTAVTAAP